ncbi:prolyl 4-Hydroxylase alpha-subunit, region [Onchocerca flexuosa]|uniref:Prolyl 4-Hydroxylase alpha-subunit, region n=1 Tax=Onchocerca flexuosa TaxID=387005 RepID=A0A238BJG3_9BILA|nr:prolyl 4-Hydroxylase alpha-subunit, region [Onchocerca flexuosa]
MLASTVFALFLLIATISAEYYSSFASLKGIIGAERYIPIMINGYVKKELGRLDYLKKFAQEIQERNYKGIRDGEEAIKQSINAFLLIEGMISDWNKALTIMQSNYADDFIHNVTFQKDTKRFIYPTKQMAHWRKYIPNFILVCKNR